MLFKLAEAFPGLIKSLQIRDLGSDALNVNGGRSQRLQGVRIECLSYGQFLACPMWQGRECGRGIQVLVEIPHTK